MPQAKAAARAFETPSLPTVRLQIFKANHPRAIDSCIDYFGGRLAADVSPENDPCGEGFLDAFAGQGGAPLTELLFVVARDQPELWDCWAQWFSGIPHVRVILDRRGGKRRQHYEARELERRRTDRRRHPGIEAELRSVGFDIIRHQRAAPFSPLMR